MSIRLWSRRAAVSSVAIALAMTAACSGPRSGASVTGDVSGCAAVLPLARHVIHDDGRLTRIRRVSKADADALSRKLGATPPAPLRPHTGSPRPLRPSKSSWPKACLVVYHGNYPPGTIVGASPPAVAGHYALIVLRVRHPAVDRVLVTDTLPA
ncbi:MAG: hypothetical protein ABR615_02860, partial [Pseudonocardiaceae bacterium]